MATITRINSDKNLDIDLETIKIELNECCFTISEVNGQLAINKVADDSVPIIIRPFVSNEILIE